MLRYTGFFYFYPNLKIKTGRRKSSNGTFYFTAFRIITYMFFRVNLPATLIYINEQLSCYKNQIKIYGQKTGSQNEKGKE